jgi:hypothetical protein
MQKFYSEGFRPSNSKDDRRSLDKQRAAYLIAKSENWKNPNSTDIHALYKVKNAGAYLTKYLAKSVTKTERITKIQTIRNEKEAYTKRIEEINKELFYFSAEKPQTKHLNSVSNQARNRIEENEKQLEKLLSEGVTGRIWGQSQSLSKISNLVDCSRPEDIPQFFEVVSSADKHFETKIGSRSIDTFIFDVTQFDQLNTLLLTHIQTKSPPN